jgi:hypothetical protein
VLVDASSFVENEQERQNAKAIKYKLIFLRINNFFKGDTSPPH